MPQANTDSTRRFSDRVENYVRYRPLYPEAVLHVLHEETGLSSTHVVADIGSGTGISSELFLRNGNPVFGVEPNVEMRAAAETLLASYPNFSSINATAEDTTLPDASVDYVVAGQAFHWFDRERARREFTRILKPRGWVVLIWNDRKVDSTPFLRAYEALLHRFGTDYRQVDHKNIDSATLAEFFAHGGFRRRSLPNEQRLDPSSLRGRLLSSSYVPNESHPNHEPMMNEVGKLFERHQEDGYVRLEYDTVLYIGDIR